MELHGSHGGDPVEVLPYDPGWPALFAAWRDRLAATLGSTARRIEHVGSTAVPGLAAKPVIDVQVSVPDASDEAAFRPALEGLGLPLRTREPGHRYFRPPRGRPREVQVHICDAGGEWERAHLLFRDYLRAHPAVREAYAALKQGLAGRFRSDRVAYNEAKSGFVLDVLEKAEEWAQATRWIVGSGAA
ncbi:MAG: GrpB family protein [Acidimicrobiia bacterium]|nr:GrpB family protein [Acidimicrobiia bacterium]